MNVRDDLVSGDHLKGREKLWSERAEKKIILFDRCTLLTSGNEKIGNPE
jgi:hypothetical protein